MILNDDQQKSLQRLLRKKNMQQLYQAYVKPFNIKPYPNKFLDIPYGKQSFFQKMDIYLPENLSGPYPVIVYIHGGAWILGGKRLGCMYSPLSFLQRGYAVVGANYRLSPLHKWPAHIHDIKAVVRYLKAHADRYQLDRDRIVLWGDSAGGHLVELMALTNGIKELEDPTLGYMEYDTKVRAVISWFGISNFAAFENESSALALAGKILPKFMYKRFPYLMFKQNIFQDTKLVKQVNPISYIDQAEYAAPILLQHGTEDFLVSPRQSVALRDKLIQKFGSSICELDQIEGAGHYSEEFVTPENIYRIRKFIEQHLQL